MPSFPNPKAPSAVVKTCRWSLLTLGFLYGSSRRAYLAKKEDARRAKEEEERPAREAAAKAEREKKNAEEMAYLGQQAGIGQGKGGDSGGKGGGTGGGGGGGGRGCKHKSECGCSY